MKRKIVSLGLALVMVISGAVLLTGCNKNKDDGKEPTTEATATPVAATPSPTPTASVTTSPKPMVNINDKFSYENDMIGIKFNHNQEFYTKENIQEVFNTIRDSIPEGRDTFNIYTDVINTENLDSSTLRLLDLSANDNIHITVSLMPFEIDKETTTIKVDGSKDVTNEAIESVELTDEELVAKMDEQITAGIESLGCTIETFDGSEIRQIGQNAEGGTVRAVITNRTYSGAVENTTETGIAEVYQCTIPIGRNAVVITLLSNGEETEIDKDAVFYEIVNSFVVTTPAPVEETPAPSPEVVE